MRLMLKGRRRLELDDCIDERAPEGWQRLKVLYCAICKTDAKMWDEGHRDLLFPRVLGHEMVAENAAGERFAIWPGTSCGRCAYCESGRENLCEEMKILGFHYDGALADSILAPARCLIPVSAGVSSLAASFAEPTGCALHALDKLRLRQGERIVIYGGGTVGLIAALYASTLGATPTVIEKSEEKIARIKGFLDHTGIKCEKDTTESAFDAALTACADPIALSLATVKLGKGGRLSFFSGLKKNEKLETNLLNLWHYREAEVHGAYGLTSDNIRSALSFIESTHDAYTHLVEEVIPLGQVPQILEEVLDGACLKYVVDPQLPFDAALPEPDEPLPEKVAASAAHATQGGDLDALIENISPVSNKLFAAAQRKIDEKTKPLGALGTVEELAVQLSLVQGRLDPVIDRKLLYVFAGDHGVAEEGVSAFPAEVTRQMVQNFLNGGAAINVLCRHHDIELKIVDMGVNADFNVHPALIREKVRKGTRNFALEPAMTRDEARLAVEAGARVFLREHARMPISIVGLGEMGIANSTSASAIISLVTGITPAEATGRGTGVDDKGLEHKCEVIEKALALHNADPEDGWEVLCALGGYELAGIAGAVLAAAASRCAVVLDGLISTAGGLIANLLQPNVRGYLISGHRSVENAQAAALAHLGITPVVDYRMRLGEGTGAAMTIDVTDAACRIMREMASFDDAGISDKYKPDNN